MSILSLSNDKTQKDPVTLLEELALQQKTPTPNYQLEIQRDFDSKLYFKITLKHQGHTIISTADKEGTAMQNAAQQLYYLLTGNYSPTSPTFPHEIIQELNKFCTYHNIDQPTFSILKIKTSPDELVYIAICKVHNLSFNGTSNTYPAAKIYAAIKALQKLKIENVLHLPSKAKRTYDPTENEIFIDLTEEKFVIPQNTPHRPVIDPTTLNHK